MLRENDRRQKRQLWALEEAHVWLLRTCLLEDPCKAHTADVAGRNPDEARPRSVRKSPMSVAIYPNRLAIHCSKLCAGLHRRMADTARPDSRLTPPLRHPRLSTLDTYLYMAKPALH